MHLVLRVFIKNKFLAVVDCINLIALGDQHARFDDMLQQELLAEDDIKRLHDVAPIFIAWALNLRGRFKQKLQRRRGQVGKVLGSIVLRSKAFCLSRDQRAVRIRNVVRKINFGNGVGLEIGLSRRSDKENKQTQAGNQQRSNKQVGNRKKPRKHGSHRMDNEYVAKLTKRF